MITAVPFRYMEHMLAVPVVVGDIETTFIFDTGSGVNLISPGLAASAGCVPLGQDLTLPMSTLSSLTLGDQTWQDVPVTVFDLAGLAGTLSNR